MLRNVRLLMMIGTLLAAVPAAEAMEAASSPQASESPLQAAVTIDAQDVFRPVSRGLFGVNVEWAMNAHGLWDPARNTARPALVELAKRMGVSLVRFPGGFLADYYHWGDGIGPPLLRRLGPNAFDDEQVRNLFGIEELAGFTREIGAEPFMTVNMISGTPQEAADWVGFCNKEGRCPTRYWELGNEPYMKTEGKNVGLTPETYVKRAAAFATAMKAIDPTIKIGAVGGQNFGRYHLIEHDRWNQVVLSQLGSTVDFLAVHNGYAPLVTDPAVSFNDVYLALLAFPRLVEENLKTLDQQVETYAPGDAGRIRLAVTEWGALFALDPKHPWIDHGKTWGSGLYVASMLRTYLNAKRLDIAEFFKWTDHWVFMGLIGADDIPKPSFLVLELFSKHLGARVVRTDARGPTYDSPAVGWVDAVPGAPYLEAVSTVSEDGGTLAVFLINKHPSQALDVTLQLSGFEPAAEGKSWVLSAPSLDANNGGGLDRVPDWPLSPQVHAPEGSLFDAGKPGTIAPREEPLTGVSRAFHRQVPPLSVTVLELERKK